MRKLSNLFWSTITGFHNLIKWFPVIWKDRDYDDYYIYKLLETKFINMERFYNSKNAYSVDAPKVVEQVKHVRKIANRLAHDDYISDDVLTANKKDLTKLFNEADKLEDADKHEFWTYIERHINEWWD